MYCKILTGVLSSGAHWKLAQQEKFIKIKILQPVSVKYENYFLSLWFPTILA